MDEHTFDQPADDLDDRELQAIGRKLNELTYLVADYFADRPLPTGGELSRAHVDLRDGAFTIRVLVD